MTNYKMDDMDVPFAKNTIPIRPLPDFFWSSISEDCLKHVRVPAPPL